MPAHDAVSPASGAASPDRPPRPPRRWSSCATRPKASRSCCRAAPSAATTTAAPGSFPGGLVDPRDRDCASLLRGLDDAERERAARRARGRARLLRRRDSRMLRGSRACCSPTTPSGRLVEPDADVAQRWRRGAARCIAASARWASCAPSPGLRLAADRLVYFSHWLTPFGRAKRFDTRFFVAPRRRRRSPRTTAPRWSSSAGCARPTRCARARRSS